jgi:ribokinase
MSRSPQNNVLVIGSINMDVVTPIEHLPKPGETIMAGDVQLIPGGKGANAAVAAARLGANVRMVGAVGGDAFGKTLKNNLRLEQIDCGLVVELPGQASGTAVILLDSGAGQNSIMVSSAANAHVTPPLDAALYEWGDVLMLQLEIPILTNIRAAQLASKSGVTVILDPAPALADLPDELFAACDIFLPNETELATLTGMPVQTIPQIAEAADRLLSRGGKHIIVTLGSRGAYWITNGHSQHFPTKTVTVVDTTAAGDSFAGALAAAMASGRDLAQSIPFALAAGSLACTRLGAQPSIPSTDQVLEFMAKA